MRKDLSLYIHIPFCESKCIYCNFVSSVETPDKQKQYEQCLLSEIKLRAKQYNPLYTIRTIYIGGGTPSCLTAGVIKRILSTIYLNFTVQNDAEITIEVNPNTITEEKVQEYIAAGVNRVSIGLQCAQGGLLKFLGRKHTYADFEKCVKLFRARNLNNISVDIIIGLPKQSQDDVKTTVTNLIKLNIPHISAYMLSVEDETPLKEMVDNQQVFLPKEKETIKMYALTASLLKKAGYTRYEVSNFAKPGYKSKHNQVYWNRQDYLGLGLAAHSYIHPVRMANTDELDEYISFMEQNKIPLSDAEKISTEEAKEECVMLSLRTAQGLNTTAYANEFKENILQTKKAQIQKLIQLKLLKLTEDGFLQATDAGFMLLNRIILELVNS